MIDWIVRLMPVRYWNLLGRITRALMRREPK
jgi:hypothetical protein